MTLFAFLRCDPGSIPHRTPPYIFMALDSAGDIPVADWLSQTHVKIYGDTIFLSGVNPYQALQFI